MDDKQANLIQLLSLISSGFEALMQHIQSLQVSHLAAHKVFDISHALLKCHRSYNADSVDKDLINHQRQVEIQQEKIMSCLCELMEFCYKNVNLPKHVCTLMDDHKEKIKDFFLASANIKSKLGNLRLSVVKREKLHQQYDKILKNFQNSKQFLNVELSKIINRRLEILQQIFHKMAELYNNIDCPVRANLFKLIADNLRQLTINADQNVSHEQGSSQEVCRS